jgi:tetratricopeptide (TPR) repeat protein
MRSTSRLLAAIWLSTLAVASPAESQLPGPKEKWLRIRSPNFLIYSNTSRRKTTEIGLGFERFRTVFLRLKPGARQRSDLPTTIFIFKNQESYEPYMSSPPERDRAIVGQFQQSRFGDMMSINAYPRQGDALPVVYHEYVHSLVAQNIPEAPLWFSEGLAEYFSTFQFRREKVEVGHFVPEHLRWLRNHSFIPLQRLVEIDHGSAEYRDGDRGGGFYAQSWLLVHYLLVGGEVSSEDVPGFMRLLDYGESVGPAVQESFGVDAETFEKRLRGYVNSQSLSFYSIPLADLGPEPELEVEAADRSEVLYQLGTLLADLSYQVESAAPGAAAHLRAAIAEGGSAGDAYASLGWLEEMFGGAATAEVLFKDAMKGETVWWRSWALCGRFFSRRLANGGAEPDTEDLAAARTAYRRAVRLMPSFGEAWALLGATYVYEDNAAEEGFAALERAHRLLPERPDVVLNHLLLQLTAGDLAAARQQLEVLSRMDSPALLGRAKDALARTEFNLQVDVYNRAVDLANARRYAEAGQVLRELLEVVTDPELALSARELLSKTEARQQKP